MTELTYNPAVFSTPDLESARRIILTPAKEIDTEERWARETPYLADLAASRLGLGPGKLVLDYGCGVGRMAKPLIETYGCTVIGCDISLEMRALAPSYVGSPAFSIVSRGVLQSMARHGLRVDAAISVWVLQHCPRPEGDMRLIRDCLAPGSSLLVVNNHARAIPTVERNWVHDGVDVRAVLRSEFSPLEEGRLDPEHVGPYVSEMTFWGRYGHPAPPSPQHSAG